MSLSILNTITVGFLSAILLFYLALRFGWGTRLIRSGAWHHTHKRPVPRLGGLVLAMGFVAVEFYIWIFHPQLRASTPHRGLCLGALLAMFALGFCDDLWSLRPSVKLFGQTCIALSVCLSGLAIQWSCLPFSGAMPDINFLGPLLTVVWLVAVPNLINEIDGIDGLAGGVSLLFTVLITSIAHRGGSFELLAGGTAGALLAFLCFNVPPARVYLGDSGAYFLGGQIGLYSLVNSHNGSNPVALGAPLLLLSLPLADAAVTAARRALSGLPLFRADRKHLHHRLIEEGRSPLSVLLLFYGLNLIFFVMSLAMVWSRGSWTPFLVCGAVLVLLACAAMFNFSRRWFLVHRVLRDSARVRNHVQHTITLTRWLALESRCCCGPDELWPSFVFAAQKLGFVDVLLTGKAKHRRWQRRAGPTRVIRRTYECSNDGYAMLEFSAPTCPLQDAQGAPACGRNGSCRLKRPRCLSNPRTFETASELLAEAWNASAALWNNPRTFGPQWHANHDFLKTPMLVALAGPEDDPRTLASDLSDKTG